MYTSHLTKGSGIHTSTQCPPPSQPHPSLAALPHTIYLALFTVDHADFSSIGKWGSRMLHLVMSIYCPLYTGYNILRLLKYQVNLLVSLPLHLI